MKDVLNKSIIPGTPVVYAVKGPDNLLEMRRGRVVRIDQQDRGSPVARIRPYDSAAYSVSRIGRELVAVPR